MIRPAASADTAFRPGRILVIDDDRRAASQTAQWLCGLGWHARAVGNAAEAHDLLARTRFDACIVDGLLAGGDAGRIVATLRSTAAGTAVVLGMPAAATAALAAEIRPDAVVPMPARDADLLAAIDTALAAVAASLAANGNRAAEPPAASAASRLLGRSAAMRHLLDVATRVADAPATLLITGESGTGKSLLAREIHRTSQRRSGRFVEVACGCLSETLLESELFGHVAGAFTGATADREGKFLQADGGTIFLDEIATASPALQVKLLRVLQDLRFEPVGGGETHAVDARVILATNEDLSALVAAGSFRADLFWRVNVITVEMPSLRDRADDIPLLAMHFLAAASARAGRQVEGFSPAAVESLLRHGWPGNVRELEHAVDHAVFLGRSPWIGVGDLPAAVRGTAGGSPTAPPKSLPKSLSAAMPAGQTAAADQDQGERADGSLKRSMALPERQLILEALERHAWRRDAAARALGINRTTLYKKLRRLGMNLAELQPAR